MRSGLFLCEAGQHYVEVGAAEPSRYDPMVLLLGILMMHAPVILEAGSFARKLSRFVLLH